MSKTLNGGPQITNAIGWYHSREPVTFIKLEQGSVLVGTISNHQQQLARCGLDTKKLGFTPLLAATIKKFVTPGCPHQF